MSKFSLICYGVVVKGVCMFVIRNQTKIDLKMENLWKIYSNKNNKKKPIIKKRTNVCQNESNNVKNRVL